MNKDEIINLLEMLYEATLRKKIVWSLTSISGRRTYKIIINGCDILVSTDFSPLNDCQVGRIDLYNSVGNKFLAGQFYEDVDTDIYLKIKILCVAIEDQLFLVTESKEKIFSSLSQLLETED